MSQLKKKAASMIAKQRKKNLLSRHRAERGEKPFLLMLMEREAMTLVIKVTTEKPMKRKKQERNEAPLILYSYTTERAKSIEKQRKSGAFLPQSLKHADMKDRNFRVVSSHKEEGDDTAIFSG